MLERAIQIAVNAHLGQTDRGGEPYILHPMRVMVEQKTLETKICAILHDVVEDTEITLEDLRREGFSEPVLEAIRVITKIDGEDYHGYIERVARNPIARRVKLIDLSDNMDLSRLSRTDLSDIKRLEKYEKAKAYILEVMQEEVIDNDEGRYDIEINGAVSVPEEMTIETFASAFLKFIEENSWYFGGGFKGI